MLDVHVPLDVSPSARDTYINNYRILTRLYEQIHISGAAGNATGRNIHQLPLEEAVRFCNAIYAISVENKSVADALAIYREG